MRIVFSSAGGGGGGRGGGGCYDVYAVPDD